MGKINRVADQIQYIKRELGLDEATIKQIGVSQLMTQIAYLKGMENVTKCDADSGQSGQYTGDLKEDLLRGSHISSQEPGLKK